MKAVQSSLWKQLSLRVLLAAILAVLLVGAPATVFFSRYTIEDELDNKVKLMERIVDQVDQNLEIAYAEGLRLCNDMELDALLVNHYRKGIPSEAAITLKIGNFVSFSPARLRSVIFRTNQGDLFYGGAIRGNQLQVFDSDAYRLYVEQGRQKLFANPVYMAASDQSNDSSYISCIMPFYSLNGITGDIVLNIELAALETLFQSIATEADEYLWLGYETSPLYSESAPQTLLNARELSDYPLTEYSNYRMHIEKDSYHVLLQHSQFSRWTLAAGFSTSNLLKASKLLVTFYFLAITLSVLLIVTMTLALTRRRLRPLEELSETMKNAAQGNLEIHSHIHSNDEIGALSDTFNYMIDELRQKIDDLLQQKKREEKMRYSLLISQINPHFIYNTLNTITYLARLGRTEEILTVNTALIKILRDSLRVDGIEIVDTVAQEVGVVDQYVTIQRHRFGEDFAMVWDIEDDIWQESIPKNIIQPLVENALQHGLRSREVKNGQAEIRVRMVHQADQFLLEVSDNGAGMSPEQMEQVNDASYASSRGEHIGLGNIRERLKSLYGPELASRMTIRSRMNEGTVVTLLLDRIDVDK